MKILHILNSNKFSGAENVVCQIISMFSDDENIEMTYCSPDGQIREALAERNVNFFPISTLSVKELKRAIRETNPDIIHAHDMRATFIASLACGKIPLISHIHNNAFDSRKLSLKSIAFRFAAIKVKHIFWVSNSAFNSYSFKKSIEKKSSVLNNIIDIDSLYKRAEQDSATYDFDVIFLGRLSPEKNPLRILQICQYAAELKHDIHFAIVGTGVLEEEMRSKAKEMCIDDYFTFFGFRQNPAKILQSSKLLILTSLWEGVPMCTLEAAAFGVPVISTPVDGLKDLIVNDVNGFLSDDNKILAGKIVEYLNDTEKYQLLSENQKKKAREWNDKSKYKESLYSQYKKC